MNKIPLVDDPEHWQRRAEEAHRTVDQLDDPVAKETMRDIARSYERLAELAEARRKSRPHS